MIMPFPTMSPDPRTVAKISLGHDQNSRSAKPPKPPITNDSQLNSPRPHINTLTSQTWRTIRENSLTCSSPPLLDSLSMRQFLAVEFPRDGTGYANVVFPIVWSHASAAQRTASSRPRTTHPSRSRSERSTRTADTPARTRSTPSAASSARWARATTPSTGWHSVMVS